MERIIRKFNARTTVGVAAVLISASYMASRLLGLFRDRLLVSHFGIGPLADAYTAAFRLPELLFTLLVSGAFAVAFIPVLAEYWVKEDRDEAWEISSAILNLLVLVTLVAAAFIFVFAGPLTTLITPGFDPERHRMTVELTRIMLITPTFFAISSVFGSIQQSLNRFFFYSIASIFYNVGIIGGILFLAPHHSIYGVAIGVVIGTILQAVVQGLGLIGLGYRYKLSFRFWHPSVIKVIKLMIPRSIDQGIDQINYTVQTVIGSQLAAGSLTAYYYANNLKNVPLIIFGSAIATATFPKLAATAAKQDRAKLIEELIIHARLILFLVIPAATGAILLRGYIVRLLFGFGNATTANLLGWFAGVIIFQSLFFLVTRGYYAMQDARTPLYTSIIAIGLNIILSILLTDWYGVIGLPMAQSIAAAIETLLLVAILWRRLGTIGGKSMFVGISKMVVANAIMAGVIYILVGTVLPLYAADRGFVVIAPKFAIICLAAGLAYLLPSYILRLHEAKMVVQKIRTKIPPLNLT